MGLRPPGRRARVVVAAADRRAAVRRLAATPAARMSPIIPTALLPVRNDQAGPVHLLPDRAGSALLTRARRSSQRAGGCDDAHDHRAARRHRAADRRGDRGLTVPDLDAAENVLMVRATKTPLDRLVPLDPSTTTTVLEYLNLPERLATHPSPTGPIFVNNRGGGFVIETIEQHFHALVDAATWPAPGSDGPGCTTCDTPSRPAT